jgi:hypothetical protein
VPPRECRDVVEGAGAVVRRRDVRPVHGLSVSQPTI